jgi:hypothetical protein
MPLVPDMKAAEVLAALKAHLARRGFGDIEVNMTGGSGAHAPDEYYIIESANPEIQGFDGATMSFVEYLYELAR